MKILGLDVDAIGREFREVFESATIGKRVRWT